MDYSSDLVIGPPKGGFYQDGDTFTDVTGSVFECFQTGSPGLWGPRGGASTGAMHGAVLLWNDANTLGVTPGSITIGSTVRTNTVALAKATIGLLTAGAISYVYAFASGANFDVEFSVVAPVWDADLQYWKKTGDSSRRCIGGVFSDDVNAMYKFRMSLDQHSRKRDIVFPLNTALTGNPFVIAAAVPSLTSATWNAFDGSSVIPWNASRISVQLGLAFLNFVDPAGILGICVDAENLAVDLTVDVGVGEAHLYYGELDPTVGNPRGGGGTTAWVTLKDNGAGQISQDLYWAAVCGGGGTVVNTDALAFASIQGWEIEV